MEHVRFYVGLGGYSQYVLLGGGVGTGWQLSPA